MLGRKYIARQVATLLQFAKSTNNPTLSAVLVEKAAELKARVDEGQYADLSAAAPDVQQRD
ncbi:hypothetical protein ACQR1W_25825 [Bradyrhizobium sp. HKCCYLS1011]|uniref:hypothetical protein n=1 Tax=Bradyrhizobium sp. HKCCYLS1011 TaxID=3420733 RepID=UPI003EBFADDF